MKEKKEEKEKKEYIYIVVTQNFLHGLNGFFLDLLCVIDII